MGLARLYRIGLAVHLGVAHALTGRYLGLVILWQRADFVPQLRAARACWP